MRHQKTRCTLRTQSKKTIIRTTFLDLLGKLVQATDDDAAVVASIRRIFDDRKARLLRSLAPVRLANQPAAKVGRRAATKARA